MNSTHARKTVKTSTNKVRHAVKGHTAKQNTSGGKSTKMDKICTCTVTKASWQNSREQRGLNSPRHTVGNPAHVVRPDPECSSRQSLPILNRDPAKQHFFTVQRQLCGFSTSNALARSCVAQHTYEVARDAVLHVYRSPRLPACTALENVWCRVNREVPDP